MMEVENNTDLLTSAIQPEMATQSKQLKRTNHKTDQKNPDEEVSMQEIDLAVKKINRSLADRRLCLEYSCDEKTNLVQIKVIDQDSGEVVREIPSEKKIKIIQKLLEMAGMIMDKTK